MKGYLDTIINLIMHLILAKDMQLDSLVQSGNSRRNITIRKASISQISHGQMKENWTGTFCVVMYEALGCFLGASPASAAELHQFCNQLAFFQTPATLKHA